MKRLFANFDWGLLISALVILVFGLVIMASIAADFLPQQLISAFLGLLFFFVFASLDYRIFLKISLLLFIGCLVFLLVPLFFGTITRGVLRWIQIGNFTLQPTELVKPSLIIFFCRFF